MTGLALASREENTTLPGMLQLLLHLPLVLAGKLVYRD